MQTAELLSRPSPRSAIKQSSMEYFLQHNKNGRELADRQKLLSQQLNDAAPPTPAKAHSPSRAKAADFFFQ